MNVCNEVWHYLSKLARRRLFVIIMAALFSFFGSWLWSLYRGIPTPYCVDEISYLLAGDTFAHGRVTNPTHPMWVHFETSQTLQRPTYMSRFQPGQGIFLALGQVLFGYPIYGVWISAGLMCAAICWMLYAWLPPRWALIGGLVAVLQFGIFTYWSQSYWGGAVSGLGGALVLGALPRIFKMQRSRDAFWLALGCALLAVSRPYEGFFVAMPIACLVLPWKIRWNEIVCAKFTKKIILPWAVLIFVTGWGMGAYNKQVTGKAGLLPFVLYEHTSVDVPFFIWQPRGLRPKFDHKVMEQFEIFREKYYQDKKTWKGFLQDMRKDIAMSSMFFFGYPLAIPALAVFILLLFDRRTALRFWTALLILLGTCAAMSWSEKPHYFSPLTGMVVLLVTVGLRRWFGRLKIYNIRAGLMAVLLLIVFQLFLNIILTPVVPAVRSLARSSPNTSIDLPWAFTREELKNILVKRGGKYLVIVKYPLKHNFFLEWVYNDADIDHAPVVWARDMDAGQNEELINYFKDRQVLFIRTFWDMNGYPRYYARQ